MNTARQLRYSYADYLRALKDSDIKLEYCAGLIYAMAAGTLAHAQLGAAAIAQFSAALSGRCAVYSSDARVHVLASDLSAFPDASIVCGDRLTSPVDVNALVNPIVIIEVTSRSTEDYDRGEKLSHYQQLGSLRAVLCVSHREQVVTIVERGPGGWSERRAGAGEQIILAEPAVSVGVDALYAGVELEPG